MGVVRLQLGHHLLEDGVQRLQFLFQRIGGQGFVTTVVGFGSRGVEADFSQTDQAQSHGDATDLAEEIFERLAELGERGVVDVLAFDQPDEIKTVMASFFEFSAAADTTVQSVQHGPGDVAWMNGRLTAMTVVVRFPVRPIDTAQNFIDQPDGIIVANHRVECRDKDLRPLPVHQRFRPIALDQHDSSSCLAGSTNPIPSPFPTSRHGKWLS